MLEDWKKSARSLFAKHFLLSNLDDAALDQVMARAKPVRCAADEALFLKGDAGDSLLGVVSGRVRISALSAEGKEIVLNIMAPGDVFGEIALLDGKARTADATAMEPVFLVALERRDFLPILKQNPDICLKLIEILCGRLRWVSDLYEDIVFLHLPARLAKRILKLADDFGVEGEGGIPVDLKVSQHELGNMTGTTREAVNKVLRGWEHAGIISIRRSALTILERDALEAIVDFV